MYKVSRLCDSITSPWYFIHFKYSEFKKKIRKFFCSKNDLKWIFGTYTLWVARTKRYFFCFLNLSRMKYHAEVIVSSLCDSIRQTLFGPNCHSIHGNSYCKEWETVFDLDLKVIMREKALSRRNLQGSNKISKVCVTIGFLIMRN